MENLLTGGLLVRLTQIVRAIKSIIIQGALLYEMVAGVPPFHAQKLEEMIENIKFGDIKFPPYISLELADLLHRLLQKDPEKRLGSGIGGSKDISSHVWFDRVPWEAYLRKEVRPPFVPIVKSESDVSHFDPVMPFIIWIALLKPLFSLKGIYRDSR